MTADESGAVRLPPGPRLPRIVQEAAFITRGRQTLRLLHRIYGPSVTTHVPGSGPTVVISEPRLIKQLFQAKSDIVGAPSPTSASCSGPGRCSPWTAPNTSGGARS